MDKISACNQVNVWKSLVLDYLYEKRDGIPPKIIEHLRGCESCLMELCKVREFVKSTELLNICERYLILKYKLEYKNGVVQETVRKILWDEEIMGMDQEEFQEFRKEVRKDLLEDNVSQQIDTGELTLSE